MSRKYVILFLLLLSALSVGRAEEPWPKPVPGWKAPLADEHPRLYFRQSDLPAIRARAETPEGREILKVLRNNLAGAYTLWHGAGYGFLYQLTEDRSYADTAREMVQKALDGAYDRDNRYSFRRPGGTLRAGPSVAAIALAYDLCFSGWEESFREKVANEILSYSPDNSQTLEEMATQPKHPPASNHFGPITGGAGVALLAVSRDSGIDSAKVSELLDSVWKNTIRGLTEGFGDGGYFAEHAGPSHMASNSVFIQFLQAARVAGGMDFVSPRPNAQWLYLRWIHELSNFFDETVHYPCRHPSSYGSQEFLRYHGGSISFGGWFAHGFGIALPEHRPALLWTYNNYVKEHDPSGFDCKTYPHLAVLSFVNWPIGVEMQNPEGIIPKARRDTTLGYFGFRNRWRTDRNEVLVTTCVGTGWAKSYVEWGSEPTMVWGHGEKMAIGRHLREKQTLVVLTEDGSGVVSSVDYPNSWVKVYDFELGDVVLRPSSNAVRSGVAVDFSGASGADALVVVVGPCAGSGGTEVDVNGTAMRYLTLSETSIQPEVRVTGDTLYIGSQSVHWDGERFFLGTFSSDTTFYAGIDVPATASSTVLRVPKTDRPISLHGNPWGLRELFDPAGRRVKVADVFRIPTGVLIGTTESGKVKRKVKVGR